MRSTGDSLQAAYEVAEEPSPRESPFREATGWSLGKKSIVVVVAAVAD